jgi:hypothetical protein
MEGQSDVEVAQGGFRVGLCPMYVRRETPSVSAGSLADSEGSLAAIDDGQTHERKSKNFSFTLDPSDLSMLTSPP